MHMSFWYMSQSACEHGVRSQNQKFIKYKKYAAGLAGPLAGGTMMRRDRAEITPRPR